MRRRVRPRKPRIPAVLVASGALVAVLLCLLGFAWMSRFCPTARHVRYWLARSDQGRVAALEALKKDPGQATVNVFGHAFGSESLQARRRADEWFMDRLTPDAPGSWDRTLQWQTWNGGLGGYRVTGSRSQNGSLAAAARSLKDGREYPGRERRIIACDAMRPYQ